MAKGIWHPGVPVRLIVHAALLQLVTHSVRPTVSYRALEIGVDPALLGAIAIAFSIVPVLGAIPVGRLADRGHIGATLSAGSGAQLVAVGILVAWSDHVAVLVLGGLLLGVGHVCGIVAQQALVAQSTRTHFDHAFASYTFYGTLGQIAAPLLLVVAGGDAALPDASTVFAIAGLGAVAVAVVTVAIVRGSDSVATGSTIVTEDLVLGQTPPPTAQTSRRRRRRLLTSVTVSMMLLALIDVVAIYLPSWGVEHGVAAAAVGVLLTVRAVGMLVGRMFVSPLVAWLGRGPLHVWSCVVAAVGAAMIALPIGFVGACVALLVSGLATGVGQPVTMAYVADVAPRATTSTWLAVRLAGNGAGMLVVPPLAGLVAVALGAGGVIVLTAGGVALAGVCAVAVLGIMPKKEDP